MSEPTDIEKKSLEAHVELCAERYRFLEEKFETVEKSIVHINGVVDEVHVMVRQMAEKRNDQLIGWGIGVIGALVATVAWLLTHYVIK
jgi:hypothetical protein